ncbi:MAG: isovaleryl-CoA dehydrogenase [Myxococcales bacterium]|nr:isovaleryl-CoA dehydrogenase [Myxococcales bacterium]
MPYETHEVLNQPPPLAGYNLFTSDAPLRDAILRAGVDWARERLTRYGAELGAPEFIDQGRLANEHPPRLRTHDRYGRRIDEVEFHPAYHALMTKGVAARVHALPWIESPPAGAHTVRVAQHYMLTQIEAGVGCPLTMTFAGPPALRKQPELADEWIPRLVSDEYDPRMIPPERKRGCLMGMAMTEKQGGSDVRANTTRAAPASSREGPGAEYLLTGHKWFCSAPMCDVFLTLAHTRRGLTCFLVPRWRPDGVRNNLRIQRLKDKLGNRSNASSEIEYDGTWARMVGDEGRGIPTIIEMVNHTRLDCVVGSAGIMRQAVAQALHHARHRSAFGKRLIEQPLMRNVLADLALESEAATTTALWLAGTYEREDARPLSRVATAIAKYWVCKRCPGLVYEALECHGGAGYVEESIMPRLYREAPLSSIWEGSGNVMCLDVLRAMSREPDSLAALLAELARARGADRRLDAHLDRLQAALADQRELQHRARAIVEALALALQAGLLVRLAPAPVADAFCAARLGGASGLAYGALPPGVELDAILTRATPELEPRDAERPPEREY